MAESQTITAPKLLESGVNFLTEYSKRFETESLTGQSLFEYIQTFSEVIGKSFVYSETNDFFSNSKEAELNREEFFYELVTISNRILAVSFKSKGISEPLIVTPTGMQGAGKGTNGDTFSELANKFVYPENDNDINFFDTNSLSKAQKVARYKALKDNDSKIDKVASIRANAIDVKTGTGGIFFHADSLDLCKNDEEREYFTLFNKMKAAMGASGGVFVESNIVAIAVNLYMAYKVLQNPNPVSAFNVDLYPRSEPQKALLKETQSYLANEGIKLTHNVVDFKLITPEEISFLVENKEHIQPINNYIKKGLGKLFADFRKQYSSEQTYSILKDQLKEFFYGEDIAIVKNDDIDAKIIDLMYSEVLEAMTRAEVRYLKGRTDDNPLTLLKRISDYFSKSYDLIFQFESLPTMISTIGSPTEVARRTFCTFFEIPQDSKELEVGGKYYELLSHYQSIVARKVKGSFILNNQNGIFTRTNKGQETWVEKVKRNKEGTEVLYQIETKDLRITLKINAKGFTYTELAGEKNIKVAWQKLLNKGFLKNYGDTNNLNTFFKNFPELSVAQR